MNKKVGFTLIELLVVIAIIAILAAILFPVFAKVREKARQTSCLSNEKQLGLAIQQYTQDYDEMYPSGTSMNWWWGGVVGWAGQLYPYVKSDAAYQCPDDAGGNPGVSYGMNVNLVIGRTSIWSVSKPTPVVLSNFQAPAKTVVLYEVSCTQTVDPSKAPGTVDNSPFGNGENSWTGGPPGLAMGHNWNTDYATGLFGNISAPGAYGLNQNGTYLAPTGRHSGGSNYLLGDGHTKWFPASSVSAGDDNNNPGDAGGTGGNPNAANTQYSGTGGLPAATFSFD